jgi:hypothetical protein
VIEKENYARGVNHQQFFSVNLPKLTDAKEDNKELFTGIFLEDLLFKVLK